MSIPKVTLTMLGASGSGKTTFLLAMYMTLHAGVHGYAMITADRDDHYDMRDAWRTLKNQGEMPMGTGDQPIQHNFIFKHDFDSLMHLDVLDFRGAAGLERAKSAGAKADVAQLRARLNKSDSIYIALDGESVGEWINRGCRREAEEWNEDINDFSSYVRDAVDTQRSAGRPAISLVVLITKADRLPAITGMDKGPACVVATDHLINLVEVAEKPGVTTLVCPVQLGDLGPTPVSKAGQPNRIDPQKMDPRFLHRPVIFSLMHYLTEQATNDSVRLAGIETQQAEARAEMQKMRDSFLGFGDLVNSRKIKDAARQIDEDMESAKSLTDSMANARDRADQLMAELKGLPIIQNGQRL
jgi:hypothetical protein